MPDPTFKRVSEFTKNPNKLYRKNKFDVTITGPSGVGTLSSQNGDFIPISFTTPGQQISTDEKTLWGPVYNMPYSRVFSGDFEMSVYYNPTFHRKIKSWMETVIPQNERVSYYDAIIGTINIKVYPQNNPTASGTSFITLTDVFPITINGLDLDIGSQNELQTFSLSFSFRQISTSLPEYE